MLCAKIIVLSLFSSCSSLTSFSLPSRLLVKQEADSFLVADLKFLKDIIDLKFKQSSFEFVVTRIGYFAV